MSFQIRLRQDEACLEQPFLSPDLVLKNNFDTELFFDFSLSEEDETGNKKGLRSKEGLHTAIIIQLFTDKRAFDDQVLPNLDDLDVRGWWGDSTAIDPSIGETGIGSHLWLLRRSILNNKTLSLAKDYCLEALQPIVNQGAVTYFDVETASAPTIQKNDFASGFLAISIEGYSQSGPKVYSQKFDVLWDQIRKK